MIFRVSRSSRCSHMLTQRSWLRSGLDRNYGWPMETKTIGGLIPEVYNQLKGVGGLRLRLKMSKGRREACFAQLDLHEEPRLAVFDHQKVHFALLLIAHVAQLEIAKPRFVEPSTALSKWEATKVSARAPSSANPLQSRWNHFGSLRRALATFLNHGRTMKP